MRARRRGRRRATTKATLLSAMEGAGKLIEDDELREAMREKGLGTPATRAQIIEGLIAERYIQREGKELAPTAKAFSLMTLLHGLGVPELFSPELTAEWEFKLAQMEHGKLKRDAFMREIVDDDRSTSSRRRRTTRATRSPATSRRSSAPCPKCGGEVHEKYKKFQCISRATSRFWKIMGGRQLEPPKPRRCSREREVGPLEGFRSKHRPAVLGEAQAQRRQRGRVRLRPARRRRRRARRPTSPARRRSGRARSAATACSRRRNAYVCEKRRRARTRPATSAPAARSCSGRSSARRWRSCSRPARPICCSSCRARTRRPFSAFLVRQPDGKVGFEFEPKDPQRKGAPAARAAPPRCACWARIRRTGSRSSCTRALRSLRQARRRQRDAAGPGQDGHADARRSAWRCSTRRRARAAAPRKPRKSPARTRAAKAPAAAEAGEPAAAARTKARNERNAEARSRRGAQAHHALDGGHCRATSARRSACVRHRQAQGDEGARKVEIARPAADRSAALTKRRSGYPARAAARGPS